MEAENKNLLLTDMYQASKEKVSFGSLNRDFRNNVGRLVRESTHKVALSIIHNIMKLHRRPDLDDDSIGRAIENISKTVSST
jgi:hypothetical protein